MTTSESRAASSTPLERAAAVTAVVALVVAVGVAVPFAVDNIGNILIAGIGIAIAVVGCWYSLSRQGTVRVIALVLIVAGLAMVIATFVIGEPQLWPWVALAVSALVAVGAAGYALRSSGRRANGTNSPASRPRHPVLLMNPKSGGGKAETFELERECRERGIEPIVLRPGDDLLQLAEDAVARGADVIGMAGGDGSQALVGTVASAHGIPHVVVPAGTRNHFALDLGLDRDDVVGALDAYADGVERSVDLAEVNGRVFVNNASLGLYAKIVQSPEYRDAKVQTAIEMLPDLIGPDAESLDLRFTGPDGKEVPTAAVIQVSNDPYELRHAQGRGTRSRVDLGVLGVLAVSLSSAGDLQRLISLQAVGQVDRFEGWREWTTERFEVHSSGPIEVGVDGEAMTLDPPLVFTTRPGALRVRMPTHASGLSPAASAVRVTSGSTVRQLLRIAAGRPRVPMSDVPDPTVSIAARAGPPSDRLADRLEARPSTGADRAFVRVLRELGEVDKAVYRTVAATPTPTIDGPLHALTGWADRSKLWLGTAAVLFAVGGRKGRRAALTGVAAVATTSAIVNLPLKLVGARHRPDADAAGVPAARRVEMPTSASFPSGHSASAAAFTAGVSSVVPALGAPLGCAAAVVGYSRVHAGVHYPGDVVAGVVVGASIGEVVASICERLFLRRSRNEV